MARIEIVDQTLRDGQQSYWGMRMRAGQILPVAEAIDGAGYRVVDLTGSSIFEVMVRFRQENPWKGLDAIRAALPRSTLRAGTRTNGIVGRGRVALTTTGRAERAGSRRGRGFIHFGTGPEPKGPRTRSRKARCWSRPSARWPKTRWRSSPG